mmetsp:Transcript_1963/g.4001  ORF Transcript_1963/g.4001 Transcript_1963/m.4001 type:complete len:376 (-) Transcript_1963:249-1376(-)
MLKFKLQPQKVTALSITRGHASILTRNAAPTNDVWHPRPKNAQHMSCECHSLSSLSSWTVSDCRTFVNHDRPDPVEAYNVLSSPAGAGAIARTGAPSMSGMPAGTMGMTARDGLVPTAVPLRRGTSLARSETLARADTCASSEDAAAAAAGGSEDVAGAAGGGLVDWALWALLARLARPGGGSSAKPRSMPWGSTNGVCASTNVDRRGTGSAGSEPPLGITARVGSVSRVERVGSESRAERVGSESRAVSAESRVRRAGKVVSLERGGRFWALSPSASPISKTLSICSFSWRGVAVLSKRICSTRARHRARSCIAESMLWLSRGDGRVAQCVLVPCGLRMVITPSSSTLPATPRSRIDDCRRISALSPCGGSSLT